MDRNAVGGFTLIEVMVAIAIIGVLMAVALPGYQNFVDKGRVAETSAAMLEIQNNIEIYIAKNNSIPPSLEALGVTLEKDKWGNDFIYVPIEGHPENYSVARASSHVVVLNEDYDLWSPGKDGLSSRVISHNLAQDDIIRANNGKYFGIAEDY